MPVIYPIILPPDEILVTELQQLQTVINLLSTHVYHLEVYQNDDSLSEFPCIVYQRIDDIPEVELSGVANLRHASFDVTVIALDSATLRSVVDEIDVMAGEGSNDTLYSRYTNLEWLHVDHDSEQVEFEIELQAKGMKTTTLTIMITHIPITA